jgi:hypothetical protein
LNVSWHKRYLVLSFNFSPKKNECNRSRHVPHIIHRSRCASPSRVIQPYLLLLFFFIILSGVRLSPLGTAATTGLLYQPQMVDDGDCGAIGGMRIGRGNRSTRRNPAPAPLCPPHIPHDQTRARTRAAAVGSQRLTA